jgi:hypothetical protein
LLIVTQLTPYNLFFIVSSEIIFYLGKLPYNIVVSEIMPHDIIVILKNIINEIFSYNFDHQKLVFLYLVDKFYLKYLVDLSILNIVYIKIYNLLCYLPNFLIFKPLKYIL